MELEFFPRPYHDEHMYGTVGRYHQRSGNATPKQTSVELFDATGVSVSVYNISNLNSLCKKLGEETLLTAEYLINKHSLLPLHFPFLSADSLKSRVAAMRETTKPVVVRWKEKNGQNRFLMHCPECLLDDRKIYGESYWHRSHQIPGIEICHKHGEWLLQSDVFSSYEQNSYDYILPEKAKFVGPSGRQDPNTRNVFQSLAKSAHWLLTYTEKPVCLSETVAKYFTRLIELGYTKYFGFVNENRLIKDLNEFYFSNGLGAIPAHSNVNGKNIWLDKMLDLNSYFNSPVNNLLFMQFLGISSGELVLSPDVPLHPFGQGPWPCLNPLASHFKEDIILDCDYLYDNTRLVGGVFKCRCGFIYRKSWPYKRESDHYRISNVLEYGEAWNTEMHRLKYEENKSFKEIYANLEIARPYAKYSYITK